VACLLRIGSDKVEKETTSVFGDFEIARREDGSLDYRANGWTKAAMFFSEFLAGVQ